MPGETEKAPPFPPRLALVALGALDVLALAVAAAVADDKDAAAAVAVAALREGEGSDRGRGGAWRRGGAAVVAVGEGLCLRDLEHRRALGRLVELGGDGRGRRHVCWCWCWWRVFVFVVGLGGAIFCCGDGERRSNV